MRRLLIVALALLVASLATPLSVSAQEDDGCFSAARFTRQPVVNQPWVLETGTWRVLNGWTNQPDSFQEERKLLLEPGQHAEVLLGGSLFVWPAHCEAQAIDGFNQNPLEAVWPDQLGKEWLCCWANQMLPLWENWMAIAQPPTPQPAIVVALPGCPPALEQTITVPSDVTVRGPAIVHPWWNNGKPNFGQTQIRTRLQRSDELATFVAMMGKVWRYADTPACSAILDREFGNASHLPIKGIVELRAQGLAR